MFLKIGKMRKICCCFAVSGILILILCFSTHSNLFLPNTVCLWVLGWIYLSVFCYFAIQKNDLTISEMMKIGIAALIISFALLLLFPIKYGAVLTQNYHEHQIMQTESVTITPLQRVNKSATAAEIWIDRILMNGQQYDKSNLQLSDGWEILDNYIYCADARSAQPLVIHIPEKSYYEIHFVMTEASGSLRYSVNGSDAVIDLYNAVRTDRMVTPMEIWGEATEASRRERTLYYAAYEAALWILLNILIRYLYSYYKRKHRNIWRINDDGAYKRNI